MESFGFMRDLWSGRGVAWRGVASPGCEPRVVEDELRAPAAAQRYQRTGE